MGNVCVNDRFWSHYKELVTGVVLPYQWDALNDRVEGAEPSYTVRSMKIAAGVLDGDYKGPVYQDSDLYKWLEAAAYSLADTPDAVLEGRVDEIVSYMKQAQQPDGYLNSYYIVNGLDKKFSNLRDCHELYCLGHMIEAAVAYFNATGKRELLDIACRYCDLVDKTFGAEDGKLKGYPGHQELELALVKLYEATGTERYLRLAEYFINQRGTKPFYFEEEWLKRDKLDHWSNQPTRDFGNMEYFQAHLPVREQKEAVGHAVRAAYLYTGMAAVAEKTGDKSLIAACETLWHNIVSKQMYITGGIGQSHNGEKFTFDYDLPNDTAYAETCASIALIFFAHKMLQITPDAAYADVLERALYNCVLSGISEDGKKFFYVNPLDVYPFASAKNPERHHVKPERQPWFGCSCCPPNISRLLASLNHYIYEKKDDKVYVNLYIGSSASFDGFSFDLKSKMPWDGYVKITITEKSEGKRTLALRLPEWCDNPEFKLNDERIGSISRLQLTKKGYLMIDREWEVGDTVKCSFPMRAQYIRANALVRADSGKLAVMRGPLVYCAEEADNGNNIPALRFDTNCPPTVYTDGGTVKLTVKGRRDCSKSNALYYPADSCLENTEIKLIPYFMWGNRGAGEMAVWILSV